VRVLRTGLTALLDGCELQLAIFDDEPVLGPQRKGSVTDALTVCISLPHCYRLTIGTEERSSYFHVDADGELVGYHVSIFV
jgi:hypothetical protein